MRPTFAGPPAVGSPLNREYKSRDGDVAAHRLSPRTSLQLPVVVALPMPTAKCQPTRHDKDENDDDDYNYDERMQQRPCASVGTWKGRHPR